MSAGCSIRSQESDNQKDVKRRYWAVEFISETPAVDDPSHAEEGSRYGQAILSEDRIEDLQGRGWTIDRLDELVAGDGHFWWVQALRMQTDDFHTISEFLHDRINGAGDVDDFVGSSAEVLTRNQRSWIRLGDGPYDSYDEAEEMRAALTNEE
jgi:hypothetical protein